MVKLAYQFLCRRRSTSNINLQADDPNDKKDELSSRDWAILLTGAQPKKYKPKDVIMKAGAANEHLYRINSGAFWIYVKPIFFFFWRKINRLRTWI